MPLRSSPGLACFPKLERLRQRRDFVRVQGKGFKVNADLLLALVMPNGGAVTRLGITVSTKVGNSVVRARLRRQLRELFRTQKSKLPKGLDVVLIARSSAADQTFSALERVFRQICHKVSEKYA